MGTNTVMVTGGAGFVGSTLVDRMLAEDRRVVVIDDLSTGHLANLEAARRRHAGQLEFQRMDVTSDGLGPMIDKHRPEVIHHLAMHAPGGSPLDRTDPDPVLDARVNVVGTVNLLRSAVAHGVRKVVVATSGVDVYGHVDPDDLPITEATPARPQGARGASQAGLEYWLEVFAREHGLEWTSLALATVYGPRQSAGQAPAHPAGPSAGSSRARGGGIVAAMAARMLAETDVTMVGDGLQTRDLTYVDDVVHALALAADRGHGRRYNIGTGQQTSMNQLFRALAAATRYPHGPTRLPERAGTVRHSALSSRRAAEDLGWKPWTTLEEGLAATLEWLARARR